MFLNEITDDSPLAIRLRNRCGARVSPVEPRRHGRAILRRSAVALGYACAAPFALAAVALMACASLPMFAAGCFKE